MTIPDEGITALTGASGSGKTTLLKLIAGLIVPDKGKIIAPSPDRIAFCFQEDRLLPGIGAGKQLEIAVPGSDSEEWLKSVGLENEMETFPEKMSGGMKRRVALARCLAYARGRELILLDEPFTGVDPERADKLAELVRSMKMPVLVTSHTPEALKMADRVLELQSGV